jgi:methylenetetrahydrofolate dehydrogenase (NADP+)/methenyltetrahydrofolate cyclohydrolase
MVYVDCKKYAQDILDAVKAIPDKKKLVILTAGNNPASASYVKGKIKDCEYCGVPYEHIKVKTKDALSWEITQKRVDPEVGGIIIQLPLPEGWNEEYFTNLVPPHLDVDGFVAGSEFKPCTPEGIMYLLRKEMGDLTGTSALVIGRGKLVGQPLAKMLIDADCTVTVAHSKTPNLCSLVWFNHHHIVVTAAGSPNLVNLDLCDADIVIDAGINKDINGKLCGDCYNFAEHCGFGKRVTPVPGGVGLMTRAMLMAHVARLEVDTV